MEKPDVDQIDGLIAGVSIDQKGTSQNPRSTVGTVHRIYDYLRLLYARIGIRTARIAVARSVTRPYSRWRARSLASRTGPGS